MARTSKEPEAGIRLNDAQRLAWLRLIRSENAGPATSRALVNQFGGAQAAIEALPDLSRRGGRAQGIQLCSLVDAEAELEAATRVGATSLRSANADIPQRSHKSMRRRLSSMSKAG